MATIPYGNSSYKYGTSSRVYGLPATLENSYVSGNQLVIIPSAPNSSTIVTKTSYSDFTFSAQVSFTQIGSTGGLIFWQQGVGSNSFYKVSFSGGGDGASLFLSNAGTVATLDVSNFIQFPVNSFASIEIHAQSGWISVVVNGQTILTAYDTTFTSGNIGFFAMSKMLVQNVSMPVFYEDIPSFTINPADSLANSLTSLAAIKAGYVRIDYAGRTEATIPQSTDPSEYAYQGEIVSHNHVQSDVEPYDYIIVYGSNGSMGTAYNQAQIDAHNGDMRINTITAETLVNNNQCATRAIRELALAQRFLNQPEIDLSVNCGLELFDVVTITDTGQGINSTYRVMNITTSVDIETAKYEQLLDLSMP